MYRIVSLTAGLFVLAACSTVLAQARVWSDVYGNSSRGTFQRFTKDKLGDPGNDRVVIRTNGRFVGLRFWELLPDGQQFVKDRLEGDPNGEHLEVTDFPREWKSRTGESGTGQFLKVEENGRIAIVIKAEKKLFDFEEFSDEDQDYIRSFLSRTGQQNLVPARSAIPDSPAITSPESPISSVSAPQSLPGSRSVEMEPPDAAFPPSSAFSSTSFESGPFDSVESLPPSGSGTDSAPQGKEPASFPHMVNHAPQISLAEAARRSTDLSSASLMGSCSNCGRSVTSSDRSCPHCRAIFVYVEDEFGNRTEIPGSEREVFRLRWGRTVVKGTLLVLAVIVGGIVKLFTGRG